MKDCDKKKDKQILIQSIANDIVMLSRNTLFVSMRFLDVALFSFTFVSNQNIKTISANGDRLYYNPNFIIQQYLEEKNAVIRSILHTILHFVFKHPFISPNIDKANWNLAVDIAIEYIINNMKIPYIAIEREKEQKIFISNLKQNVPLITAEKIYHYFKEHSLRTEMQSELASIFIQDDHSLWYINSKDFNNEKNLSNQENDRVSEKRNQKQLKRNKEKNIEIEKPIPLKLITKEQWQNISERIKIDLETTSKEWADQSEVFIQNIQAVNRDQYNYTSFLKKFAVLGEAMQINDDEFDYAYYTYGLNLYGNIPLVEPLEYKEVKRIKDFVIAIDTSASCSGEIVQLFLKKTYSILEETESFFNKIQLHIIQCDAEIQSDYVLTSADEFDNYLKNMEIKGLGGTDFRPVFSYVEELIDSHILENLKGLIYFTDGYGRFPTRKPSYQTAFVFLNEEIIHPQVPPWAIKIILGKDDIKEIS